MTEEHFKPDPHLTALSKRASAAATALQQQATGAAAPDLRSVALVRRVLLATVIGGLAIVLASVLLVSAFAAGALPWVVGAFLSLATVGAIGLGVHAGGHGWFVPLPVIVLAGAWAMTASAGNWRAPTAWTLACLTLLGAVGVAVLVVPAITSVHALAPARGTEVLVGTEGVALGPLGPTGVVKVKNETWTAESLSGPLPAGATVHVVKVEGLRLLVWSEAGTIPGPDTLGPSKQEREEQ